MARWKIMTPHYLNVDGTEWQYTETDRSTGRLIRKNFPVPRYVDPNDPGDWTSKWGSHGNEDGEVIVCHAGKGEAKDIVFVGDPTPDMVPMDDEAREISASFEYRWAYKPDTGDVGQYSQSLIDKFQREIAEAESKPATIAGMNELIAAMTAMTQQQSQLLTALAPRRV